MMTLDITKKLTSFGSTSSRPIIWTIGCCHCMHLSTFFALSQSSMNGVGLTKPLNTSLNPISKHSSHLRKPRTVFRCLGPFKIGIHIYLEQSVWAELSWSPFWKRIASICFGPKHWGKKFWGKIWIFEKVIFNFSAEFGFFWLTWRVTLL